MLLSIDDRGAKEGKHLKDINLLLTEESQEESTEFGKSPKKFSVKPTKKLIYAAIGLIVAVALLFIPKMILNGLNQKVQSLRSELLSEKYQQVRQLNHRIDAVSESLDKKRAILREIDKEYASVMQILTSVTKAQPINCSMQRIDYKDKKVTIQGTALNSSDLSEWVINLDRLESMEVNMENESIKVDKTGSRVTFQLTLTIGKVGDE